MEEEPRQPLSRLVLCRGIHCRRRGSGRIFRQIKRQAREQAIILLTVPCFRVCGQAPVLVLYPRGEWYGRVTVQGVRELLQGGTLDRCLIYRMGNAEKKASSNPLPKTPSDLH